MTKDAPVMDMQKPTVAVVAPPDRAQPTRRARVVTAVKTFIGLPVSDRPDDIPTRAKLGWARAVINAFFGVSADFYPRVIVDGRIRSLPSPKIMAEMGKADSWATLGSDGLDDALALATQSLNEVKSQTEYQDQKATRVLTVTTFLTAFSGVLFIRFEDNYDLSLLGPLSVLHRSLVWGAYTLFALFILAALSGALVIFHATRTRFKYSPFSTAAGQEKDPKSLEFYAALIAVRPSAWTAAWVKEDIVGGTKTAVLRTDIKARYLHDMISETYLVAAKTADKLRYLEPGQKLLAGALRFLFLWLILIGILTALVPPVHRAVPPTDVRLLTPAAAPQPVAARPPTPAQIHVPTAGVPTPAPGSPVQAQNKS